jgi:peptidoglycan/LPS O-acetylase OafA/YrhL
MKTNTEFVYLLRFIAAILVVFRHYSPIRNVVIDNGDSSVGFFFLLSGFILVVAYSEQIMSEKLDVFNFYLRRFARIYPLYLLALILTLFFHFFIKNGHTHLAFKLPFELLMLQSWFYPGSINYPAWSLSCEIFFYFLFPFYILKLKNLRLKNAIFIAVFTILTSVLISYFIYNFPINFIKNDLKTGYLIEQPFLRICVFLLGNVLGFIYLRNIPLPKKLLIALFLCGGICFYLWSLNPIEIGLSLKQLGFTFLHTALIFTLIQNPDFSTKYLSNKFFMTLGDISYGVYLLQYPVYSFTLLFTDKLNPNLQFFIYLIVLILVSFWVYKYFEKPMRHKITFLGKSWYNSTHEAQRIQRFY